MRKLSVSTLVSLDGVVQDPGGFGETEAGGWAGPYFDEEAGRLAYEHLVASDMFLMGRETYELFKQYWPQVHEGDYAARINYMPKLVASTSLQAGQIRLAAMFSETTCAASSMWTMLMLKKLWLNSRAASAGVNA